MEMGSKHHKLSFGYIKGKFNYLQAESLLSSLFKILLKVSRSFSEISKISGVIGK